MLCIRCMSHVEARRRRRSQRRRCRTLFCTRCGAAILTLAGVPVGVGDDTLARLGRFGLASTGEALLTARRALLEPERGKG
jgi:hypothetical protein